MDGTNTAHAPTTGIMCTYSGRLFSPLAPKPEDISILDIAHGLANVCRYGGQCKTFYSVAQHSVLVAKYVSSKNAKWGLLHDASEAYIGDIIHPLKVTEQYDTYREIEDRLMAVICERFDLELEQPEEVKEYDLIVRATEMRDFGSIPEEFWIDEPKLEERIDPVGPEVSKVMFENTFSFLFKHGKPLHYFY